MNNTERRRALTKARENALMYAEYAESLVKDAEESAPLVGRAVEMATMWANVGQVMKVGNNFDADGVTER